MEKLGFREAKRHNKRSTKFIVTICNFKPDSLALSFSFHLTHNA